MKSKPEFLNLTGIRPPLKFGSVYLTTYLKDARILTQKICVCVCEVANRNLFFSFTELLALWKAEA